MPVGIAGLQCAGQTAYNAGQKRIFTQESDLRDQPY